MRALRVSSFLVSMTRSPPRMVIATPASPRMTAVAASAARSVRSRGALPSHHSFARSTAAAMALLQTGRLDGESEVAGPVRTGLALRGREIGEALRLAGRRLPLPQRFFQELDPLQRVARVGLARHRADDDLARLDVEVLDVDLDLVLGRQRAVQPEQEVVGGHLGHRVLVA